MLKKKKKNVFSNATYLGQGQQGAHSMMPFPVLWVFCILVAPHDFILWKHFIKYVLCIHRITKKRLFYFQEFYPFNEDFFPPSL